ncbi:hypothetical protein BROOK1789C_1298 [Bathymodiolus brooksi thiotrophic gill symbiont]|nr:hypothetical protein BROOK1789C_1298 [Bathymodiolus brooksi thiotrophic gill symbiont]
MPKAKKKTKQKNIIVYLPKAKKNNTKKYNSLPAKGKKKNKTKNIIVYLPKAKKTKVEDTKG